jgi:hypothetical protein
MPTTASTVPLIFVATRANKYQPDGVSLATGTQEYGVVRTVTSKSQSLQLYGVPHFVSDVSGNQFHGDARNEYGLLALNDFLGICDLAYVVRANVNLDDSSETFMSLGTPVAGTVSYNGVGTGSISSITATSSQVKPSNNCFSFN